MLREVTVSNPLTADECDDELRAITANLYNAHDALQQFLYRLNFEFPSSRTDENGEPLPQWADADHSWRQAEKLLAVAVDLLAANGGEPI